MAGGACSRLGSKHRHQPRLVVRVLAASNQLITHYLGGNWYIVHYYVPVIGVIHVMIFARLLKGDPIGRPGA
jgi:hypothetical protein